ncbi:15017_t:CDS:2 [Gigaspora margarita]|uniref:15017_t:CDS:1 n=1 Tax=Gigaspora margarita TaxID=4874 RepID=A0ABN7VAU8_GIGMA|nr:15017_t:CDS:2 [Gigaspora margarita]
MKCEFDRKSKLDPRFAKHYEKLRNKFEKGSLWSNIWHSPFFTSLYALGLYPRVLLKHRITNNSLHPSLTIYQETAIRTLKRTFNSPLTSIRKNVSFFESLMKTFKCTEPITPLGYDTDFRGYWLGADTWQDQLPNAILLYVHGGPYVSATSLTGIESLCFLLKTLRTKYHQHIRVLAIDYELASEDPFPVGLNDLERVYRWLVSSGKPGSERVFLLGAVMVLGLLQRIYTVNNTDGDSINPLGALLISPWVELSCDSFSHFTNAKYDYLSNCLLQFASEYYVFGKRGDPNLRRQSKIINKNMSNDNIIFSWLKNVEDNFDLNDIKAIDESNRKSINIETEINLKKEITKTKSNEKLTEFRNKRYSFVQDSNEKVTEFKNKRYSIALDSRYSKILNHDLNVDNDDVQNDSESRLESILEAYNKIESRSISTMDDSQSLLDSLGSIMNKKGNKVITHKKNDIDKISRNGSIRSTPGSILRNSNDIDKISRNGSIHSSRPPSILRTGSVRTRRSRNSVRFSDFIEIHTETENGETSVKHESLTRKNSGGSRHSDISKSSKSKRSLKRLRKKKNSITKKEDPFRNPYISPLHTPHHILAKYPPLFVSYGGKEVLRDDIEMFCQKCINSKKGHFSERDKNSEDLMLTEMETKDGLHPDVVVEMDEDMVHDYPILLGTFGEHSRNALTRMATFINDLLPKNHQTKFYSYPNSLNSLESSQFPASTVNDDLSDSDYSDYYGYEPSKVIMSTNPVFIPKPINVPPLQPLQPIVKSLPKLRSTVSPIQPLASLPKSKYTVSSTPPIPPIPPLPPLNNLPKSKSTISPLQPLNKLKSISISNQSILKTLRESMSSTSTYSTKSTKSHSEHSSNASIRSHSASSDIFANSRKIPIKSLSLYPIIPIKEESYNV